ncbi:hypothetical protein HUA74_02660 [Myxococcus sp. CA051A]|uniref:hypothetical protein n=1 Tax=Myxococcus sp. CA051A TaxID=2741739 RepID=UPI00157B4D08|nr:hypothetical protein [Myxococcus sp. CA051A]NTX59555.1 hypothetical protein [Myxococcus sp. CA051A]
MAINELNVSKREVMTLENDVTGLREEVGNLHAEQSKSKNHVLVFTTYAVVNLCGVILVGIAINYLTSERPPNGTWVILSLGGLLSLVGSVAPVVVSLYSGRGRKGGTNAN